MILTLEEVKKFFRESPFTLTEARITMLYNMISDKSSRVNNIDKQWMACEQDHEIHTAVNAIQEIRGDDTFTKILSEDSIKKKVLTTCSEFKEYTHKPRIPFYIMVLDKLI